jgi:hypothetical protein
MRQKFIESIHRMLLDAHEYVPQPSIRIDIVQLARGEQRIEWLLRVVPPFLSVGPAQSHCCLLAAASGVSSANTRMSLC